jgi:hydrogenase maturation protease
MNTLVIGYGNSLRGDDGVGPLVAEQVAEWNLPDVRSLSVHQLTPELASEMALAKTVIFIDAYFGDEKRTQSLSSVQPPQLERASVDLGSKVRETATSSLFIYPHIERLYPSISFPSLVHILNPSVLLNLTKTLYDSEPLAYQILIPAIQFDVGASLSNVAADGIAWTLETLNDYFANTLSTHWSRLHA